MNKMEREPKVKAISKDTPYNYHKLVSKNQNVRRNPKTAQFVKRG